jgi:outer membrane protein assembly factor BamB
MKILLLFTAIYVSVTGLEGSWPAFLGVGSKVTETQKLPLTWSPNENVRWKKSIPGHGQSSPVVWDNQVFVTTTEGPMKDTYLAIAFDADSGDELWRQSIVNSNPVENSVYVSRAAATPVVDSDRLITFFESGQLICFDHAGKQLWQRDLSVDYGKFRNKFGLSGSPTQDDSNVYILVDDEGPSYVTAIAKSTGSTVWKMDRSARKSWASPNIITIAGEPQLVISSSGTVDGYDCNTGRLLWSFDKVGGNSGTTPLSVGDGLFLVSGSPGRDGENTEMAKKSNLMMQVSQVGSEWEAKPLWISDEATPSWGSPIVNGDCAYWVNRSGVVYCIDSKTGELHYKQRTKESCWATPFPAGDRIYFFGKEGTTTVLAAGREFKVLAENVLWNPDDVVVDAKAATNESSEERRRSAAMFSGPTQYGFAVSKNRFYIRTGDQLFCVGG